MKRLLRSAALTAASIAVPITTLHSTALAQDAVTVLGHDFTFPNQIDGMPAKLSDFRDLQIHSFTTSDGVKLSYWEAGKGEPLVFVPGWSANGAMYFYVMYLLKDHYHVYVLEPRNQGLSQRVSYGATIPRFAQDLHQFLDHIDAKKVNLCGWSMGASVIWSYVDLFGEANIKKLAFVDEPPSIYSHTDWSEEERLNAGAFTSSPEAMIDAFGRGKPTNRLVVNIGPPAHPAPKDTPYYLNAQLLGSTFIQNDPDYMNLVLFNHIMNDWRNVISEKVHAPTAIFTGENSNWLQSQKWINGVVKGSRLFIFTAEESGDHMLLVRNPVRFTQDLSNFLTN